MTNLHYNFVLGTYLQPLMLRAQMTWFSLARQAGLLTSTLGRVGKAVVSRRLASNLTGFPAEILQAKLPAEALPDAPVAPRSTGRGSPQASRAAPRQAPSSHNWPLLHPNLLMGFGANPYSDICWFQNLKYSRSCVHLGSCHPKFPLKCNPDELLGMDSTHSGCPRWHSADCFQKGPE